MTTILVDDLVPGTLTVLRAPGAAPITDTDLSMAEMRAAQARSRSPVSSMSRLSPGRKEWGWMQLSSQQSTTRLPSFPRRGAIQKTANDTTETGGCSPHHVGDCDRLGRQQNQPNDDRQDTDRLRPERHSPRRQALRSETSGEVSKTIEEDTAEREAKSRNDQGSTTGKRLDSPLCTGLVGDLFIRMDREHRGEASCRGRRPPPGN